LAKRYPSKKLLGIDYLHENIEICRNFGLPAIRGDVYHLDLENDCLDMAIFMEVIEHLEEPERAIREIWRVLKPGGKLAVIFPNDAFLKIARILLLRFREAAYDPGHVHQWTHGEMKSFLNKNGFLVYSSISVPFKLWHISLHGIIFAHKNEKIFTKDDTRCHHK